MEKQKQQLQQFEVIDPLKKQKVRSLAMASTIDICKKFFKEQKDKDYLQMEQQTQCSQNSKVDCLDNNMQNIIDHFFNENEFNIQKERDIKISNRKMNQIKNKNFVQCEKIPSKIEHNQHYNYERNKTFSYKKLKEPNVDNRRYTEVHKKKKKNLIDIKDLDVQKKLFCKIDKMSKQEKQKVQKRISEYMYKLFDTYLKNYTLKNEKQQENLENQRENVIKLIEKLCQDILEEDKIQACSFGSYKTKLLTKFSDIDVVLVGLNAQKIDNQVVILKKLEKEFSQNEIFQNITPIYTAQIPIIKVTVKDQILTDNKLIQIDIQINNKKNSKENSCFKTTKHVLLSMQKYPTMKKNLTFLKTILGYKNMHRPFTGGLNSYGMCLLYEAYLIEENIQKSKDHFNCLFGFMSFLSHKFNHIYYNVNTNNCKQNKQSPFQFKIQANNVLEVYDPTTNYVNNVTSNCFNYPYIVMMLGKILQNYNQAQNDCFEYLNNNLTELDMLSINDDIKAYFLNKQKIFGEVFEINDNVQIIQ